jgi:hypothetical protein
MTPEGLRATRNAVCRPRPAFSPPVYDPGHWQFPRCAFSLASRPGFPHVLPSENMAAPKKISMFPT